MTLTPPPRTNPSAQVRVVWGATLLRDAIQTLETLESGDKERAMRVHVRFHHTTRALPSRHGNCPALPCSALPSPSHHSTPLSPAYCCSPCSSNPMPRLSPQTFCAVPLSSSPHALSPHNRCS